MEEVERIREAADHNYQASRDIIGDSVSLIQDLVDLYDFLGKLLKRPNIPPSDEIVAGAYFLFSCRYQLTLSAIMALRGHLSDSFYFSRKAIELCAFAARVKKHPRMAMDWLQAWHNKKAYGNFKKNFSSGKLFPNDHRLLRELYSRFDHCSKQIHPSVYSLGGHIEVEKDESGINFNFNYFQVKDSDLSEPIRTVLWIVDTHFGILRIFEDTLKIAVASDLKGWELRINSVDAKIAIHKARWKDVIEIPTSEEG